MSERRITVVGSLNLDVRLAVERLPRSGETIAAHGLASSVGGKGANQAAAAARLGATVRMVGAVGTDGSGSTVVDRLRREGVDVSAVDTVEGPTGTAVILWERPESTIVIDAGANAALDAERVRGHAAALRSAGAVLCQLETPASALDAVLENAGGLTVLNPAPAPDRASRAMRGFDVLVPNRHELAALAGAASAPATVDDTAALAASLGLPGDVVVTLGGDGALVLPEGSAPAHVAAERVRPVDTTAAGDSFCAALAGALLDGASLTDAARWGNRVAAATTTRDGAMEALPLISELTPGPPSGTGRENKDTP